LLAAIRSLFVIATIMSRRHVANHAPAGVNSVPVE
jgi:hypothetical protein